MVELEYAKAIYELAIEENKVDLFDEYFRGVSKTLKSNKDFLDIIESPVIDTHKKREIVSNVYKSLDQTYVDFLLVLVDHARFNIIDGIGHQYRKLMRSDKNIVVVDVTSAKELTQAQKKLLDKTLNEKFAEKKFEYKYNENPDLIGGVQIIMNGVSIDMSLKASLDKLKEAL